MQRGIAENAMCSKWAGGLGGSWTAVRGTGAHIERHQRREPGRHPVPQAAQRPARRRQPGRQARRLRLRLPRDLAQRHPRLPRAAAQHRRRAPPHARHEHRELDSRPVHEARGGARAPGRSSAPTRCPTCTTSTARAFEAALPRATSSCAAAGEIWRRADRRRSSSGSRCSRCSSRPATRGSPSRTRATSAARRTTWASSTPRNLCTEITLNTSADETAVCNLGSIVLDQHLTADGELDHEQAARDDPHRRARARQRHRHQLLPDRGGATREHAPPPGRPRRHGPAVRALPPRHRLRLAGGASSSTTR